MDELQQVSIISSSIFLASFCSSAICFFTYLTVAKFTRANLQTNIVHSFMYLFSMISSLQPFILNLVSDSNCNMIGLSCFTWAFSIIAANLVALKRISLVVRRFRKLIAIATATFLLHTIPHMGVCATVTGIRPIPHLCAPVVQPPWEISMSTLLLIYSVLMISLHIFAFNELSEDVKILNQAHNGSTTLYRVSQIMLNLTGVFLVNIMLAITRLSSPNPIMFLALIYGLEILAQFILTRALFVQHFSEKISQKSKSNLAMKDSSFNIQKNSGT
ncbi:hypothetical protein BKA69DRAFT_1070396 [Paraphysoderma sedebokerense]|nr:hypothetical protein BKA69DRAFT_1070396 [Paraphysoderma sedebokerense]